MVRTLIFPYDEFVLPFHEDLLDGPEKWKVNLKLDALSQANHLAKGQAHHAMVDVEATVACKKAQRKKFNWLKF